MLGKVQYIERLLPLKRIFNELVNLGESLETYRSYQGSYTRI